MPTTEQASPLPVLDRAAILAQIKAPSQRPVSVDVPEWGGRVFLRSLTASERDAFDATCGFHLELHYPLSPRGRGRSQPAGSTTSRGKLAALVIGDAENRRLFADEDAALLGDLPAGPLDRLLVRALALNALAPEAEVVTTVPPPAPSVPPEPPPQPAVRVVPAGN